MRALALFLVLSPSLAFAKRHGHEKPRAVATVSAASDTPAPRVAPMRSAMVEQADDDERPGSRQRK